MNDIAEQKSSPVILPYAWVILVVVFLASIAAPLNRSKVPPLMPVLMDTFQLSLGQAGWLMSVFAFTGLFLSLPTGITLQKIGPKALGMIALACLSLGAALGALSSGVGLLLVSRVIEGVGLGLIAVVAPAAIVIWFPPTKRGMPMGIWATWVPVGTVTMYALAPALGTTFGWQVVWWIGAGFAVVVLILYGALMRLPPWMEGKRPERGTSPNLGKSLEHLANKMIWLLGLEFSCFTLVFSAFGAFFPTYLSEELGYSLSRAAWIASILTFVVLFSAPLAGWVSDRIGSRRLVFSVPFAIIAIMMLFPYKVTGWQIYALMMSLGFFVGAIPAATFAATPEVMGKPELAGLGLAVVVFGQNLGMFIGPILFGNLVDRLGWVTAGYCLIPICILGFATGWMVKVH